VNGASTNATPRAAADTANLRHVAG
jgi:hypothetical protein